MQKYCQSKVSDFVKMLLNKEFIDLLTYKNCNYDIMPQLHGLRNQGT